jgi:hypothetical protein
VKSFTISTSSEHGERRQPRNPNWRALALRWLLGAGLGLLATVILFQPGASVVAAPGEPDAALARPIAGLTPTPSHVSPTPTRPSPIVIAKSVEGRPLEVYAFGTGARARMIVADIHGGYEWNTAALAERLVDFVTQHPAVIPPNVTLYILPSMNPDGLARSRGYEGRANANGVDLNRNFPFEWKATWGSEGCWSFLPITSGAHPLSEPESQAVARFLLGHGIDALISYHSAALGIFAGGDPSTPGSLSLARSVAEVAPYAYPPINTGCDYSGEMVDWAASNGIAAVDIELSTHHSLDEAINLRVLYTFLNWRP